LNLVSAAMNFAQARHFAFIRSKPGAFVYSIS
jgi:hypothetical protein